MEFDSKGVWNQYIMRDLIDGANQRMLGSRNMRISLKALETRGLADAG